MNLLVVMKDYPFPPRTGSSIVAYNCMKFLSRNNSIDLVCMKFPNSVQDATEFVNKVDILTVKKPAYVVKKLKSLFYRLNGIPPLVSSFSSKEMEKKVLDVINNNNYDYVLAFELSTIQYCPPSCFHKLVVNIEDPQSIKLRRMIKLPVWSVWQKTKMIVSQKLTARYERKILPQIAKVALLSKIDIQDMCEEVAYKNLLHIPYGTEIKDSFIDYSERERTIIFSGNMYHKPNVDAAIYFLRDIFPLVLRESPLTVLWIVGANPDKRIYEAAGKYGKNVVITGRVEDITAYIKKATVSICPVRLKIGVQTKVLEALSVGTPVVTTSAGNSGVCGKSGVHLWVEDKPEQFALRIISLLKGHNWNKLSEGGRKLINKNFSWETNIVELEGHLDKLTLLKSIYNKS